MWPPNFRIEYTAALLKANKVYKTGTKTESTSMVEPFHFLMGENSWPKIFPGADTVYHQEAADIKNSIAMIILVNVSKS